VNKRIGDLELLGRIGEGGMGVVERAHDHRLDRDVAVKLLTPGLLADDTARARFDRECHIAATLQHPNVVPVYDVGAAGRQTYVVMMLVDGPDLARVLAETGPLEPARAVVIIGQVAAALDAAHERDLVHRDVKPGNILLARAGGADHAYLTDFGLARAIGEASALSRSGGALGTLGYVAPEQLEGAPIDGRADTYSLACVAYEALTGQPPFGRGTERALVTAHLTAPPPRLSAARSGLPPALDGVIARGMAKHPAERYASSGEFARALARALTGAAPALALPPAPTVPLPPVPPPAPTIGLPTTTLTPGAVPPPAPRRGRVPLLAGVLAVLLLVGLGAGGMLVLSGGGNGTDGPGERDTTAAGRESTPASGEAPGDESAGAESESRSLPTAATVAGEQRHIPEYWTEAERALWSHVPPSIRDLCEPNPNQYGDTLVEGAAATLTCDIPDRAVQRVSYWSFPALKDVRAWWARRQTLSQVGSARGDCWDGRRGEGTYEGGRLMCTTGVIKVRWYDEDSRTYGVVSGKKNATFRDLVAWWRASAVKGGVTPAYTNDDKWLLQWVPPKYRDGCHPLSQEAVRIDSPRPGQINPIGDKAIIECYPPGVEKLQYFLFESQNRLVQHYEARLARGNDDVPAGTGCANGASGRVQLVDGELGCFYSSQGFAMLRWTDISRNIYGTLQGVVGQDIGELYRWWDLEVRPSFVSR